MQGCLAVIGLVVVVYFASAAGCATVLNGL